MFELTFFSDQLRQRSFKERINILAGEFGKHLKEMTKALDVYLEVSQGPGNLDSYGLI